MKKVIVAAMLAMMLSACQAHVNANEGSDHAKGEAIFKEKGNCGEHKGKKKSCCQEHRGDGKPCCDKHK